jgi:hypothetical protein
MQGFTVSSHMCIPIVAATLARQIKEAQALAERSTLLEGFCDGLPIALMGQFFGSTVLTIESGGKLQTFRHSSGTTWLLATGLYQQSYLQLGRQLRQAIHL